MSQPVLDAYTGTGTGRRISFEDVDQQYRLKVRAFIGLCVPPIFEDLERDMGLNEMRTTGVVPIMFFFTFETSTEHLAFKGRVETRHTVRLHRDSQPHPTDRAQPAVERLLLDMQVDVLAQTASYDPRALGSGEMSAEVRPVGRMRCVNVLTKPTAPAGQRGVTQVPDGLRKLTLHSWDEAYPSVEGLEHIPGGFQRHDCGNWRDQRTVWGLSNTDINQHVNVHEYIINIENHFARMLHGAQLAVPMHRVERTDIIFRKPAFMGEVCVMRGDLYTRDDRTLLLAGFYNLRPNGQVDPRPSVFARIAGRMLDGLPADTGSK